MTAPTSTDHLRDRLEALQAKVENSICCDCSQESPGCVSIINDQEQPIGAFLCSQCAGAHKMLGPDICSVLSLHHHEWTEEELKAVETGGNRTVNKIFEGELPLGSTTRPDEDSSLVERQTFCRQKYADRQFFDAEAFETWKQRKNSISAAKNAFKNNRKTKNGKTEKNNNNKQSQQNNNLGAGDDGFDTSFEPSQNRRRQARRASMPSLGFPSPQTTTTPAPGKPPKAPSKSPKMGATGSDPFATSDPFHGFDSFADGPEDAWWDPSSTRGANAFGGPGENEDDDDDFGDVRKPKSCIGFGDGGDPFGIQSNPTVPTTAVETSPCPPDVFRGKKAAVLDSIKARSPRSPRKRPGRRASLGAKLNMESSNSEDFHGGKKSPKHGSRKKRGEMAGSSEQSVYSTNSKKSTGSSDRSNGEAPSPSVSGGSRKRAQRRGSLTAKLNPEFSNHSDQDDGHHGGIPSPGSLRSRKNAITDGRKKKEDALGGSGHSKHSMYSAHSKQSIDSSEREDRSHSEAPSPSVSGRSRKQAIRRTSLGGTVTSEVVHSDKEDSHHGGIPSPGALRSRKQTTPRGGRKKSDALGGSGHSKQSIVSTQSKQSIDSASTSDHAGSNDIDCPSPASRPRAARRPSMDSAIPTDHEPAKPARRQGSRRELMGAPPRKNKSVSSRHRPILSTGSGQQEEGELMGAPPRKNKSISSRHRPILSTGSGHQEEGVENGRRVGRRGSVGASSSHSIDKHSRSSCGSLYSSGGDSLRNEQDNEFGYEDPPAPETSTPPRRRTNRRASLNTTASGKDIHPRARRHRSDHLSSSNHSTGSFEGDQSQDEKEHNKSRNRRRSSTTRRSSRQSAEEANLKEQLGYEDAGPDSEARPQQAHSRARRRGSTRHSSEEAELMTKLGYGDTEPSEDAPRRSNTRPSRRSSIGALPSRGKGGDVSIGAPSDRYSPKDDGGAVRKTLPKQQSSRALLSLYGDVSASETAASSQMPMPASRRMMQRRRASCV